MLGEPALLVALPGGDAQGETLLAEQRVAAIPRAHRPDGVVLGEVADEAPLGVAVAHRVHPAVEVIAVAEVLFGHLPHAGHHAHVEHHVERVGDHHPHLDERRGGRAHDVRHHVHRTAAHGAFEESTELAIGLVRRHPIVHGASLGARLRTDVGEVLGARDVVGIGVMVVAARPAILIERDEHTLGGGGGEEALGLGLAAVAPVDALGVGELGRLFYEAREVLIHHLFY